MEDFIPARPTRRSEKVATAIAVRICDEINIDDFYWTAEEKADRVIELQMVIESGADFGSKLIDECARLFGGAWAYEGLREHTQHIAEAIAHEEEVAARRHWYKRYYGK